MKLTVERTLEVCASPCAVWSSGERFALAGMAFPTKAAVTGVITGLVMRVFGVPTYIALFFGIMTFMGMGGLLYTKLVFKTLPRDLW